MLGAPKHMLVSKVGWEVEGERGRFGHIQCHIQCHTQERAMCFTPQVVVALIVSKVRVLGA